MSNCQACGSALHGGEPVASTCPRCLLALALDAGAGPLVDDDFGAYELVCLLGRGGSADVYLAFQQEPIRREVALKVLREGLDSPELLAGFAAEQRVLGLLNHPHIAQIYDAGMSRRGRPYLVMQMAEGEPVTTYCDGRGLALRARLRLFIDICHAVEYAHRKGVLHRDLKPSNVLVGDEDGQPSPKVIDFGIAKMLTPLAGGTERQTEYGRLVATPEYMSPEAAGWDEQRISPASDIYSLGVMLFELLTGTLPFSAQRLRRQGLTEAVRIVREEEPPALTEKLLAHAASRAEAPIVTGDLAAVVRHCLEKRPGNRYGSAGELARDLERVLQGEPVQAPRAALSRVRQWRRRVSGFWHRPVLAMAAVLVPLSALLIVRSGGRTLQKPLDAVQLTAYSGTETAPSFSPDSRAIAFAWDGEREDNWDIYRLTIGDTTPVRLTSSPAVEYSPAWSPDGREVAFLRSEKVHTASVVLFTLPAGPERTIATVSVNVQPRKRWLAWSPDGRYLLLSHNVAAGPRSVIFAIDAQTGAEHPVTNRANLPGVDDGQPSIPSHGRTLWFARDADTPGQIWSVPVTRDLQPEGPETRLTLAGLERVECSVPQQISESELLFSAPVRSIRSLWRARLGGAAPTQIAELPGMPGAPQLSADGRKLVYAREQYDSNVWRLDLDHAGGHETGRVKILNSTMWDQNAALSPDGRMLAFESNRVGFPEIWRALRDGTQATQLSHLGVLTSSPMWSPDGSQIAFHAAVDGQNDVFVMPALGGETSGTPPRNLTRHAGEDLQPVWTPDGQWIYFCSNRSGRRELWRMRPAAPEIPAEQVTREGGFDVAFSPDGQWLYYSRLRASTADIWRRPVAGGGREELVLERAIGGHVAVTSYGIYAARPGGTGHNSEIVFVSAADRAVKVLASTPLQIKDRLTVSADGRSVYYTQVDVNGADLMLVSNFR